MAPKAGESLKNYNSVITAGNNGTKPTGTPYDWNNWRNATTWPSIYGNSPKVNWNSPLVPDSITYRNLGCSALTTTVNCNNSGSGIGFWTGLTMACTSLPMLTSLGQGIAGLFNKGDKSSDSAESACDSNLAEAVDRANNIDKKTSITDLTSLSQTLSDRITTAGENLKLARLDYSTAEATITKSDQMKTKKKTELGNFDTGKRTLEREISDLELQLSGLDKNDENYDTQKKSLEDQIKNKKDAIEKDYSDTKRKAITDEIDRLDGKMKEWALIQAEAKETMDKLPNEIEKARKAKKKVDDEITKRNK